MIRRLAKHVGEFWRDTVLTPVTMIGEVSMEVLLPTIMALLIDRGITEPGSMADIIRYGSILVACALVSLACGVLAGHFAASASAGFGRNLRRAMYDRVQQFSFRNIDKFSTASLITRLTTDTNNVQNAFQMIIRVAVRAPLMLVFSLIMSFRMNPKLSLIFLTVIPVLGAGLYYIITHAHPIFKRVFKTYDRLNTVVRENLHGIRVVKSYVREAHENEKFQKTSADVFTDFTRAEKLLAFNGPLMQLCMYACVLLISWFGAKLIVGGGTAGGSSMTVGEVQSIITYAVQILMSLMMLSMIFVMVTIARSSAERIDEVLSEEPDLHDTENPDMEVRGGAIDFDHVSFSYSGDPERMCLKDINLHIPSGATVGILGGTGSAKSTLVQLIPRLYDTTSGVVRVGGRDVRGIDIRTLRDQVAMVLQKNELFSGTVADNLRWGNENATDEELRHVCRIAQADAFVSAFPDGYNTHIEQGGTNVSGGQKQRLCIARALLKKPRILIMDDSTSAVDTATDYCIRTAMREEMPGTTKIIIAQRVASVMDADLIVVMDNGCVRAQGTHEELMRTSDIYREVYTSQVKEASEHDA